MPNENETEATRSDALSAAETATSNGNELWAVRMRLPSETP